MSAAFVPSEQSSKSPSFRIGTVQASEGVAVVSRTYTLGNPGNSYLSRSEHSCYDVSKDLPSEFTALKAKPIEDWCSNKSVYLTGFSGRTPAHGKRRNMQGVKHSL
ncbi:hypothetical protein I317_04447 [Kwoniella heveanensis CBS 569]|uniref:Uncharacterized protein n=1 Tax=Kwoniella heveanensis BCC8398 TaxID=1296120 RepID=A0A1B9GVE6_9TREE|nr:hypothetical protein I316_03539 [Kwoniella heveanensis BCC8398]OCF41743.1 hypothetical protein I317_04447 [Kwoniella heveanensis CBS 569]